MLKQLKALGLILVIGGMLVGCEETEEIENIDLQGTQPQVEEQMEVPVEEDEPYNEHVEEEPIVVEEEHKHVTGNCILCAKMTLLDADTMLCDQCKNFAQCYDCGEYKNMNYMVFDGNKYHCGCAEEALVHCDRCGEEVDVNDTVNYGEGERYCYPCNEEQLKEEGLYINLGN